MNQLIAIAARILPGILSLIARAPDNRVQDAVIRAVTAEIGAPTAAQAQAKLSADPGLQARIEASSDLQIALANIALEQEKEQSRHLAAERKADLAQQVQRDKAQA